MDAVNGLIRKEVVARKISGVFDFSAIVDHDRSCGGWSRPHGVIGHS
jgi:hypothetical protein